MIQEYDLDQIVRQALRKFAGQFYRRKLNLSYQPLNTAVLTDEKWLAFVIEQVLSNALKYTPAVLFQFPAKLPVIRWEIR